MASSERSSDLVPLWLMESVAAVSVGGFAVGAFAAILVGAGRFAFYLKSGEWITSGCEVLARLQYDAQGWCSFQTQWIGLNEIANAITGQYDVSFMLFLAGAASLMIPLSILLLVLRMTGSR